jgi:DNA-binding response OmpR family regulator
MLPRVRVLVVDDERALVTALERGLRAEGFAVDTSPDGVDGLARARSGDYDAVVLDVMLPGSPATASCRRCGPRATGCPCSC